MKYLLKEKDLRMTSLQIAKLTGKRHDNVLRDIDSIISELSEMKEESRSSDLRRSNYQVFETSSYKDGGRTYRCIEMNFEASMLLLTGYSVKLRSILINEWSCLKEALQSNNWTHEDKEIQKRVMGTIQMLLGQPIKLDYIKANTIVNKAASNLHGFAKMVKKGDMTPQMLKDRQEILEAFEKLFEIDQDISWCKQVIYNKYRQPLLEE